MSLGPLPVQRPIVPSLRPLRRSLRIFVRSLRRYYAVVRAQRAPTASVPEGLIAHRVLLPAHRFSGGGSCQGLPVPAQEFPSMPGVSDLAGSCCLALSTAALLPSVLLDHVGSLNSASFRGSIPSLPVPLSTLRDPPFHLARTAHDSGPEWALPLFCRTLSFPTLAGFYRRTKLQHAATS